MSWLLKWLHVFRRRCRRGFRRFLRSPLPPRSSLILNERGTPLPFLSGANLPWLRYGGDFGANAWSPTGGMAAAGKQEELRRHLRTLKAQGIGVLRWFLFCDGRAGIRFTAAGTPVGPDDSLYADIDVALETVAAEGMKVVFVLFDFLWFDKAAEVNGVQTGGRSRVVSGATKQQALRRRVITPLLERYGYSPAILAWDIINEPEWATRGWGGGIIGPRVSFPAMRRFIRRVTRLVHRHTIHMATVGLGNASGLPLAQNCGLDFYQVHWYDRWQDIAPLERPVLELDIDRPLLLGEYPTKNSTRTPATILAAIKKSGYCGAFAWSLLADDEFSGMKETDSKQ